MRDQVEELERENRSQKVKIGLLSGQLRKVKKILEVLQSKKTRTNKVKRNLLVYHALNKHRDQEIQTKSDASSFDSDQSTTHHNHHEIKEKLRNLNRTIRNQRQQIHELNQQIFNHQVREDDHQTLREDFDRLNRHLNRMTKKNSKLKETW